MATSSGVFFFTLVDSHHTYGVLWESVLVELVLNEETELDTNDVEETSIYDNIILSFYDRRDDMVDLTESQFSTVRSFGCRNRLTYHTTSTRKEESRAKCRNWTCF